MASRVGRPRSTRSHDAILTAAQEMLLEEGSGSLTIEAVAKRAGVGKPTIYRWWPSLADLVLEILLDRADKEIPIPADNSLSEILSQFLRQSVRVINEWAGIHLRFLLGQAQLNEAFRERFRGNFVEKRRAVLRSILQEAVQRDELSRESDLDVLVDMIFGAMWYRLLIGHAPLDEAFADELTRMIAK